MVESGWNGNSPLPDDLMESITQQHSYGSKNDSRDVIKGTGFGEDDIRSIEEKLGFSFDNTFDRAKETTFQTHHSGDVEQEIQAQVAAEPGLSGVDITLYYDDLGAGQLAHEATHAKMMQPHGNLSTMLPEDNDVNHSVYGEFVAYLAEHEVDEYETPSTELTALWQQKNAYEQVVDKEGLDSSLADNYQPLVAGDDDLQPHSSVIQGYKEVREDTLAKLAAGEYELGADETVADYIEPSETTYNEVLDHINNVEDDLLTYF